MSEKSISIFYETSQEAVESLSKRLRPVSSAMAVHTINNAMYLEVMIDEWFFDFLNGRNDGKGPEAGGSFPEDPVPYGGGTWD